MTEKFRSTTIPERKFLSRHSSILPNTPSHTGKPKKININHFETQTESGDINIAAIAQNQDDIRGQTHNPGKQSFLTHTWCELLILYTISGPSQPSANAPKGF